MVAAKKVRGGGMCWCVGGGLLCRVSGTCQRYNRSANLENCRCLQGWCWCGSGIPGMKKYKFNCCRLRIVPPSTLVSLIEFVPCTQEWVYAIRDSEVHLYLTFCWICLYTQLGLCVFIQTMLSSMFINAEQK